MNLASVEDRKKGLNTVLVLENIVDVGFNFGKIIFPCLILEMKIYIVIFFSHCYSVLLIQFIE